MPAHAAGGADARSFAQQRQGHDGPLLIYAHVAEQVLALLSHHALAREALEPETPIGGVRARMAPAVRPFVVLGFLATGVIVAPLEVRVKR